MGCRPELNYPEVEHGDNKASRGVGVYGKTVVLVTAKQT